MNRTFHVRTKIISGAGSLAALPAELSALPASRWALVADAGHLAAGDNPHTTVDIVVEFLDDLGWR